MTIIHSKETFENLLPNWKLIETVSESPKIDPVQFYLTGLVAENEKGKIITGSAASTQAFPIERAYGELVERCVVADLEWEIPKGSNWTFSRSNGVAFSGTFTGACLAAELELVERDRLMRSWLGETLPQQIALPSSSWLQALEKKYSIEAYVFPLDASAFEPVVCGIFGFPIKPNLPRFYGTAAAAEFVEAFRKAEQECAQGLGFLTLDSLPIPEVSPSLQATAQFHLEYYLVPQNVQKIRQWLNGTHYFKESPTLQPTQTEFVDLTPKNWNGGLHVVKATNRSYMPLIFGRLPEAYFPSLAEPQRIHPIC